MRIIINKRLSILVGISLLSIFMSVSSIAVAEEMATAIIVELHGNLAVKEFVDANDKVEKEYILSIEPIDVSKDKFGGPVKHITEIQLVFPSNKDGRKYINKRILVKGILFYPITAHHHTKVLLEVKSIALLKGRGILWGRCCYLIYYLTAAQFSL